VRFVTFDDGLDELVGVLSEGRVIPLSDDAGDLLDLIVAGDTALDFTRAKLAVSRDKGLPLAEVRLLAPLRRFGRDILCTRWNGDRAEFFPRRADTVLGPYDVAYDPTVSAELAVVIGRPGRDLPRAAALDHVWGYTLAYNNIDAMAIGPCVITPDEFGDPPDVVATLISELSVELALRPGDLLLTGTSADADAIGDRVVHGGLATFPKGERP
jgi:hypothetical protein